MDIHRCRADPALGRRGPGLACPRDHPLRAPFADPEPERDPARRLRGRLGGAVTLWTTGTGPARAGLTVSSLLVAHGEPARVLGLLDPDADLADALAETGTAVVAAALAGEHRDLADAFAGVAPGARAGRSGSGRWTRHRVGTGARRASGLGRHPARRARRREVGWSLLVDGVVEHVDDPRRDARSRWCTGVDGTSARPDVGSLREPPDPGAEDGDRAVSETEKITVMVVDDHPMWREGVARDLTEAGLRRGRDRRHRHRGADPRGRAYRPRVVVLDLQIPAPNGVEVTARLVKDDPTVRVLILSASGEQEDVLEAVKAGATGYLVKSASRAELLVGRTPGRRGRHRVHPGARRAGAGGVPPALRHARPRSADPDTPRLTDRETEVLRLVAKGLSYKQIAERLFLSHRTVQNHVQNTLRKLQLHNRVQLVRYAIEQGLDDE